MKSIRRLASSALVALFFGSIAVPHVHSQVTIDWVTVGNPGNANDTINTGTNPNYGAVNYEYRIGKCEVTIQQYTDFLNAVAKSNPYFVYKTGMATNLNIAGISRSGTSGGYTYSVIGPSGTSPAGASSPGNRPIAYVTWFDAARFANWMQNGQGSGSTETGAYTLNGATSGTAPAKNPGAQFYIPTENEWYKAAYYSPVLNSGSGGYYTYATQSNTVPGNNIGSGANQANYFAGKFSVTQSSNIDVNQNCLTGAAGSSRGRRGGSFASLDASPLASSSRTSSVPSTQSGIGFRLASPVPEPATCASLIAGLAIGGYLVKRRRKRA